MSTCAQLQAKLDGYLSALEKLATGKSIVKIQDGEKSLQYGAGDVKRLDTLIREVKLQMRCQGCAGCRSGGMIYLTPSG